MRISFLLKRWKHWISFKSQMAWLKDLYYKFCKKNLTSCYFGVISIQSWNSHGRIGWSWINSLFLVYTWDLPALRYLDCILLGYFWYRYVFSLRRSIFVRETNSCCKYELFPSQSSKSCCDLDLFASFFVLLWNIVYLFSRRACKHQFVLLSILCVIEKFISNGKKKTIV